MPEESTKIVWELATVARGPLGDPNGGMLGTAFTAGFTLLAGFLVGYYGGRWLDGLAGTTPWLTLVGTILGIVAGFRVLIRDILRGASPETKRGSDKDEESGKPDRG